MKIKQIAEGFDVAPLLWTLQANPQLWNEHSQRTRDDTSPHREVDDIWVRYAPPEAAHLPGPHDAVWYPSPAVQPVKELVYELMHFVEGDRLGGVLITRIKAGKSCKRHSDRGWHAEHYDKFAIQVQSAPGQAFSFEGEALEAMPGDVYTFDNSFPHWVDNPTEHDRITLIVCIRTDRKEITCRGE